MISSSFPYFDAFISLFTESLCVFLPRSFALLPSGPGYLNPLLDALQHLTFKLIHRITLLILLEYNLIDAVAEVMLGVPDVLFLDFIHRKRTEDLHLLDFTIDEFLVLDSQLVVLEGQTVFIHHVPHPEFAFSHKQVPLHLGVIHQSLTRLQSGESYR